MMGQKVFAMKNFATENILDIESDEIPKEKMLMFDWPTKRASPSAVPEPSPRSNTTFSRNAPPNESKFAAGQLSQIKTETQEHLESLWTWLQENAHAQLA